MKKIILLFCFLFALVVLFAQEKQANYSRVKIYASNQEHFNTLLKNGVCLENLDIRKGVFIIGEFSDLELEKIQETEIPYEILIENMSEYYVKQNAGYSITQLNEDMKRNPKTYKGNRTPEHFHLGSMGGYFTLAEIMTELDEMRAEFPHLISAKAPFSLQTIEGRNIYWVRISNNPDVGQEKPRVLYTALTHAREPAGMHQMIYQMWDLLENYGVDPEITYYLDNLELYFVPCVCPDGYEYNRQTNPYGGGMWRKNRKGGYGIDLNRNWGYKWGYDDYGSSPYQWDETYRGTAPFSEIETQVLKNFCENTEILLCLNNHTYGNYLVYPYGYINSVPAEYPIYREYAERLTSENRYSYGNTYQVLNYYGNGGSEDWFCGERDTKNLVISFCPEAGDPYEGFWPPASRIEEICAGHVLMNKYMMRFALPYAEIEDKTGFAFHSLENTFKFELLSLGKTQNANFEVIIEPVSNNIQSVQTTPLLFENLNLLDRKEGEFQIVLMPGISSEEKVIFDICVNNGIFTHKYRYTKLFGIIEKLFEDDCETMDHWISSLWGWGLTTLKHSSPAHSIADSPYGNYWSYENNTIYSKDFYDLTGAIAAFAEFEAQWDIEANYDYVQFLVSANNGPWVPQSGKYTKTGSTYQGAQPVYDGVQMNWVHEVIDLSEYIGKNIKVGFELVSDMWTERDGFYFDDFVLSVIKPKTNAIQIYNPRGFVAYYNSVSQTISINDVNIPTSFSLISVDGKILDSFRVDNKNYEVNVSKLQSGVYFLKTNFGEARKIVIY
jgi:murein tripeptide amidase MpaA